MEYSEILYKIVNNAADKRGKEWWIEPTESWGEITQDEARDKAFGIVGGSEIAAVEGISKTFGLGDDVTTKLIGPKAEDGKYNKTGEIYTSSKISPEIATKIQEAMNSGDKDKNVLNILSTIHDTWVRNNPDNFLATKNGKPRNKEYQFVPLELLSWKEVESDFVFLKPILEAAGVEIDEKSLQQQFELSQKEFLIDHGIYSKEQLKGALKYSNIYPILDGLETKNGGNIKDLMKNDEILDKMVEQIMGQIDINSKEDLLKEIQESENPLYNDEYHVKSDKTYKFMGALDIDEKMSMRDILISKLTEDRLREENAPTGEQNNFTFTKTGQVVTPKDIAKASQEKETTKGEVSKVKAFFDRILGRDTRVTENDGRDEE